MGHAVLVLTTRTFDFPTTLPLPCREHKVDSFPIIRSQPALFHTCCVMQSEQNRKLFRFVSANFRELLLSVVNNLPVSIKGSDMGDFSSCNRTIKRQLFRKNRTIQVLFFMAGILFMITMYKHLSCDGTGEFREQDTNGARVTRLEPTSSHKLRENIFLFIMVLTAPNGQERRTALRKTWLSNIQSLDSKVVVKFIIGGGTLNEEQRKNLKDENKLHRDILLLPNVNDSYSQLTNKVLQTFRWIDQNINCVFVLKVDDDTFVRLDTVVSELRSSSSTKKFYWGFFRGDAHVKSKGSWLENNWNLCDRYLPYAQGGGYILSSDLVHFIAKNSDLLRIFNSEDVSVGKYSVSEMRIEGRIQNITPTVHAPPL